ncbi:HTH-type transcriptional repressor CytR [Aquimixticola soesokkakensis]|uniref:HTH-type transcriptional repressor CytR n=1 Tax=Aquimixticola soesokkakensis TaxID=1519096 RepID=A0A1Y5RVH6_9RHOB|nr:substrate-binding domain-containing protein [Aquimixticola soesokkakensis]SLN26247.1 HTH-type transcriptional repressor CytR [Aquimixticola soesokkakensis]
MQDNSVRIKDVARVAGVSTSTVSRTLTRPDKVSRHTRDIVQAAVQETGYRFNHAASNFRKQRTGTIAAFIPNIANPYYPDILSGLAAGFADTPYTLVTVDTAAGQEAERLARPYFDKRRADALVVTAGSLAPALLTAWRADGQAPPVVEIGEGPDPAQNPRVSIRNAEAAAQAVAHLVALGHRRIGFVNGPQSYTSAARLAGVMGGEDARARVTWTTSGPLGFAFGQSAAREWMGLRDRPTGVFCATDVLACGFIGEVMRNGLRVPQDVSVIGFDDVEGMAYLHPALTTIRQPRFAMGQRAAQMVCELLDTPRQELGGQELGETVMAVTLVVRDSTGAPPASSQDDRGVPRARQG